MTAAELVTLIGAALGGGGLVALVKPVLDYLKGKRRQTDEVAMGLVSQLQTRVTQLEEASESERRLCDARLEVLRLHLKNVEGDFDALLLAIEVAPDKAVEVVAKVKARRAQRASEEISHEQRVRGEVRQTAQVIASADRVLGADIS